MARFTSELTPEQIVARLEKFSGKIPLKGGQLWVERENEDRFYVNFCADGEKKENITLFKGRIEPGETGGCVIRGRCGQSALVNALLAIPMAAILFLILFLLSLGRRHRGYKRNFRYAFWVMVQSILGTEVSIALLCGSLYVVCFLPLLSCNINVREQANRKIIYEFLKEQVCGQTEAKDRER